MNKTSIRNEAIRDCLRIVDGFSFPKDPYNLTKDRLFFRMAELIK